MKKIILFLFIFLSFNLLGANDDKHKLKINNMLKNKNIINIDETKLYKSIDSDSDKEVNSEIINKCIEIIHSKDIKEDVSVINKNGFYVLDNNELANGYYNIKTNNVPVNLYLIYNGQFKEWYRYSKEIQNSRIGGIYSIIFFDNATYDNFINSQKNISVLGSMDRTYYFFEVDEQKQLTMPIIYVKDYIEKVGIFKEISSGKISILYKVYKTVKVFYQTWELFIDANFECFSIQEYKSVYQMFEDYKITIGFGISSLEFSDCIIENGEDSMYKVNKFNIYNKDGTIDKETQKAIEDEYQSSNYNIVIMRLIFSITEN